MTAARVDFPGKVNLTKVGSSMGDHILHTATTEHGVLGLIRRSGNWIFLRARSLEVGGMVPPNVLRKKHEKPFVLHLISLKIYEQKQNHSTITKPNL